MIVIESFIALVPISLVQSLIYAFVALGIMLPFRILSFPDLTAEGSFPLGACLCAACLVAGLDAVSATGVAVLGGMLAGCATAYIHMKVRINTLLCGILVLTMLYSINIRIMGLPNIPLFAQQTVFDLVLGPLKRDVVAQMAFFGGLVAITTALLYWFLGTQIGAAMRAVGASPAMARAQGIDVGLYTIAGLGIANGLVALAGALLAQSQGFADVNLGFGVLINGLAAVILGETIVGTSTIMRQLLAPVAGSILYYQVISFALALGLKPSDLKFVTGLFVLLTLLWPSLRGSAAGHLRIRE